MKFCPTCKTEYDEEVLRFCMKDGTPLVEKDPPNFIQMPSESLESADEDFGEETIIRRKPSSNPIPPPLPDVEESFSSRRNSAERIVIPTIEETRDQNVRARTNGTAYSQPPPKSNTAKVVILTILGTIFVLAAGAGVFWMLRKDVPTTPNTNVNTNPISVDTNLNTNTIPGNFDFNLNSNSTTNLNINSNANVNVNAKSPTPTPKPSPSPTATPSPSPTPSENTNTSNTNSATNSPTPRPSPPATPRPSATPARTPMPLQTPPTVRPQPTTPPVTRSNNVGR
ncbi:MAG TPA: hypothetical protein PKY59_14100 [Pyrinomonadaceae bacterium]|nr:hypothetical protein [Pyrinomonadaceae bacterium]